MEKIRILQLGKTDFSRQYEIYPDAVWFYEPDISEKPKQDYDMAILDRSITEAEGTYIYRFVRAYCLFCLEDVEINDTIERLLFSKRGSKVRRDQLAYFLKNEPHHYFAKPYGEKFRPDKLTVARGFRGKVHWNGCMDLTLEGDYGDELNEIAYWRYNVPLFRNVYTDLWLEYEKTPGIEIALKITEFAPGTVSDICQERIISEEQLQDVVPITNLDGNTGAFISLLAKGEGKLSIIALHSRLSRNGRGCFLPGGERIVTSQREEAFFYFDPANMKPPLNVYFSGYKTQEGFEGFNMMRRLGCPFLLVSEARLEGGAFYMGTPEYEEMFVKKLQSYLDILGFTRDQVIFSGLSMGTFGAMYYGCDIRPHAILVGKPLASIGNVAYHTKTIRPGEFSTSLDVLRKHTGRVSPLSVPTLNERFWDRFDHADWGQTKFIAAYMIEDDYDAGAYQTLISHLKDDGVQIIGKGLHGRHNDNTGGIVSWFISQYAAVLREDFGQFLDEPEE